ncbi:MAG: hypothetical protein US85_C0016G0004 [Candidatus Shapirobacteria bacterium GW2011_GWF1_38_23]|nr:MAG: hypothetical protein US85_C0016G0004 [Candidatus Shapirobacteria bacterium GW2011_GWF1_38_23]
MTERCELLAKAQALANHRGLDSSRVECPFLSVCRGTRCYMFDPDTPNENFEIAEDLKRIQNSVKG